MTPSSRTIPDTAPAYCTPFGSGAVLDEREKGGGLRAMVAAGVHSPSPAVSCAAHEQLKRSHLRLLSGGFVGCIGGMR